MWQRASAASASVQTGAQSMITAECSLDVVHSNATRPLHTSMHACTHCLRGRPLPRFALLLRLNRMLPLS